MLFDCLRGGVDDIGWKKLHADVFRYPPHPMLFCSLVGVGVQFLCVIFAMALLFAAGAFGVLHRGNMVTAGLVLYGLTSGTGELVRM